MAENDCSNSSTSLTPGCLGSQSCLLQYLNHFLTDILHAVLVPGLQDAIMVSLKPGEKSSVERFLINGLLADFRL